MPLSSNTWSLTLYSCLILLEFSLCVLASEASYLRFLISLYSVVKDKSNSMSLPKTICAGEAFSTVCTVERIAQAQLAKICDHGS
jgi:hypothetical protein